ncbi:MULTISPECIES: acetylornithine deacetylase [unclassified Pseudomonas]|uniref:acetylornithine deacetylase n=1 Tax=unclassified Pseudomonas TaxID=196821 RepID=UPI000BCC1483|nr:MULTISPECIES: acetylornithine deacetylase [unclassified Pseudomonas]PVZ20562.1 acetylornithine deacetylase [Pseudomonas sp. URIL14HWK12:I12]PVZ27628.1 acetylornithine deacetylase [Pseudomonas sp. URIL14HWK12:I10]PVZ38517.1 acetylornithine deacetylase [Pseudomonas sp. URIL14HWK12:I11]SNZ03044.1 acetylornithine deacetylase [Pseudomonas sp. URIL14HWK12:I9]
MQQTSQHPTEQTLKLLRQLIAFNTVSRDSNLGLIEWTRDYLQQLGAQVRLTYDATRNKANLFATYGEAPGFGTVFSGHTDVVPVDGQAWQTDPFVATLREGRLYGRGTCDMKGFIAVCLSRLPHFANADLKRPVHLALSYDEELGCLGVGGLLDDLKAHGIAPVACIVGEPTSMQPVMAHKGKRAYRCCVQGLSAHSSSPSRGINAVDFAAELIVKIREIAAGLRTGNAWDTAYDVPYSTLTTTTIKGGIAVNTVPEHCEFVFEHRFLPGDPPQRVIEELNGYVKRVLLPQMQAEGARGQIRFEPLASYPGLNGTLDDEPVARAMRILGAEGARKVGFGTEAGLFAAAGIPAVICGPGDIAQAHKPDEFITLDQLARCESFFDRYVTASSVEATACP